MLGNVSINKFSWDTWYPRLTDYIVQMYLLMCNGCHGKLFIIVSDNGFLNERSSTTMCDKE